jgi:hypothetical protein
MVSLFLAVVHRNCIGLRLLLLKITGFHHLLVKNAAQIEVSAGI